MNYWKNDIHINVMNLQNLLIEKRIKSFVKKGKITLLFKTIPGIGDIVAFLIRYEIDDISSEE